MTLVCSESLPVRYCGKRSDMRCDVSLHVVTRRSSDMSLLTYCVYINVFLTLQGLPVTPKFLLTTVSRGLYLRIHK
jgi:hypothetical protein